MPQRQLRPKKRYTTYIYEDSLSRMQVLAKERGVSLSSLINTAIISMADLMTAETEAGQKAYIVASQASLHNMVKNIVKTIHPDSKVIAR